MKPYLRDKKSFSLSDYPEWTAYEAGFLTTKNSGWRSRKPVVIETQCKGCMQCYLYCPEGVIYQNEKNEKKISIDYDFCKGCGICEKICKFKALEMKAEHI